MKIGDLVKIKHHVTAYDPLRDEIMIVTDVKTNFDGNARVGTVVFVLAGGEEHVLLPEHLEVVSEDRGKISRC